MRKYWSLLVFVACFGLFVVIANGPRLWWLLTDSDYCGWPAVTRCRICDNRVWTWQDYERREIPLVIDNPDGVIFGGNMTGLMHTNCKGQPKPTSVSIELVPSVKREYY